MHEAFFESANISLDDHGVSRARHRWLALNEEWSVSPVTTHRSHGALGVASQFDPFENGYLKRPVPQGSEPAAYP